MYQTIHEKLINIYGQPDSFFFQKHDLPKHLDHYHVLICLYILKINFQKPYYYTPKLQRDKPVQWDANGLLDTTAMGKQSYNTTIQCRDIYVTVRL